MNLKSRSIIALLVGTIGVIVTSLTVSFAWFASNRGSANDKIQGSVLESYFDKAYSPSGTPGSETNPYVITTPKHFENLVKLYTRKFYDPEAGEEVDFSKNKYYFEIGKQFEDGGEYYVYDYDNYGAVTSTKTSKTLNLKSLNALEPIGNDDHPFISNIWGHDLTVKNFTINPTSNTTSQTYNDVGIFGLVQSSAEVKNVYFSDFVIDASGSGAGPHSLGSLAPHPDDVRIGYIAGHVKTYKSFSHTYVNNCKIKSPNLGSIQRNEYGYYGMVEEDKIGSALPEGKNYNYTFDSEIWHQYFNTNLSSIQNYTLTLRNTVEGASSPDNIIDMTNYKFSTAITKGDYLTSYYIRGQSTDGSTYGGLNTSLSTIGYRAGDKHLVQNTYPVKYSSDGSNFGDVDSKTTLSDKLVDTNEGEGYYYAFDTNNKQWEYYYCDNHKTVAGDTFDITFTFASSKEWVYRPSGTPTTEFLFYVDQSTTPISHSGTGTIDGNYITWTASKKVLTLPLGTHSIAVFCHKNYTGRFKTYNFYYLAVGSNSNNVVSKTTMPTNFTGSTNSKGQYVITATGDMTDIHYSSFETFGTYWENNLPTINTGSAYTPLAVGTMIKSSKNANYHLYYSASSNIQLKNTDEEDFSNAFFKWDNNVFKVTVSTLEFDENTKRHFVADEDEVTSNPEKKYDYQCIDVVGGGVGFFYYTLPLSRRAIKICRIVSESNQDVDETIVKEVTSSDLETKFYAPGRCNQSIVLYVRNTGSAIDEIDDELGTISFNYWQLSSFNTVHPSFKKGASATTSNFVDFSTIYGEASQEDNYHRLYTNKTLKESDIKKVSYCCLDEEGRILGAYDSLGKNRIGLDREAESRIATYVIVIGAFTNANVANWHLWVDTIEFKYKSNAGDGGSFGSVGYRSATEKIDDTILNFFMEKTTTSTHYMIEVIFTSSTKRYDVNVKCSVNLKLVFYNYYPTTYSLYVNNSQKTGRTNTVTVTATSVIYPNFT